MEEYYIVKINIIIHITIKFATLFLHYANSWKIIFCICIDLISILPPWSIDFYPFIFLVFLKPINNQMNWTILKLTQETDAIKEVLFDEIRNRDWFNYNNKMIIVWLQRFRLPRQPSASIVHLQHVASDHSYCRIRMDHDNGSQTLRCDIL